MIRRIAVRFSSAMTKVANTEAANSTEDAALHRVESGRVEKKDHEPHDSTALQSSRDTSCSVQEEVNEEKTPNMEHKRVKTQRFAMLLGYQGKNYFGMQVQRYAGAEVCPTIESHILDAMFKLGWITDALRKNSYDFFFQRAARTDKAVSAVRQMISCQMPIHIDLPVKGADEINVLLPPDIRVFGFRRATKSFHAQKNCDARTYTYTLPTFALAKPHERTDSSFRIDDKTLEQANEVLKLYVGTHNFFNYTSGKAFEDRSCFRYILSFDIGKPFLFKDELRGEEVEFVTCSVKGQSFMLHQIRKMIGMMIVVVRDLQHISAVHRSFHNKERMDVPKAPGLGLLLDRLHYDKYDRQFGKVHSPLSNWGEEVEAAVEKLKQDYILSEIMSTEITTQSMMQWLADLVHHNFIGDESGEIAPFVTAAAKTVAEANDEAAKFEETKEKSERAEDGEVERLEEKADAKEEENAAKVETS